MASSLLDMDAQQLVNEVRRLQSDLTAAQAEADRLRVDAERYRWLRNSASWEWVKTHCWQPIGCVEFDRAIDHGMQRIHAAKTEQERGE